MTQNENKVKWCLTKAEKEMKESGRHRGLILISPDKEAAQRHILKAEHNLRLAYYVDKGGFSDWSANAFFYSMYHCCLALISHFGYESKNQECTIAVLEKLQQEGKIKLDPTYFQVLSLTTEKEVDISVIGKREEFQYGTKLEIKPREFEALAKEMIEITKEILFFKIKMRI